jgi:hypothetical protein
MFLSHPPQGASTSVPETVDLLLNKTKAQVNKSYPGGQVDPIIVGTL